MSVVIKVAFRVRPFTLDGPLGVIMRQDGDEQGEVELIHNDKVKGDRARFPFTWSWWSAHNWKHHVDEGDLGFCEDMTFVTQKMCYEGCGAKVKADVLGGNAVVLFAYGLSGSGKTFTVFGMDAADNPASWFQHAEPHEMWGILPQLAYELFSMKTDGWKFTMQYFQNVVDIVRDLMSKAGEERMYKEGFKKDEDGFMFINWLQKKVIQDWDDLRKTFVKANARKAIAPTQFNPQSTRGHCVMTLEVEMPKADDASTKQRGRIYVCDLAGTEPAGDVFYAIYEKVKQPDGSVELLNPKPHQDQTKTKSLQDQGKKINLSLSEMAQFFMKMAEAIKKKTLKPGKSIPGCNSYFLCKYLKDTMLQARTYLFCAIRPEAFYHKYTFATLGFGKNASVIKLSPKKAMGKASPAERKLMQELESMKAMVAELKKANEAMAGGGGEGGGGGDGGEVSKLQAMLAEKQAALASVLEGGEGDNSDAKLALEDEEYQKRGIFMAAVHDEDEDLAPHLFNLDEDNFRSKRFLYPFLKEETVFGPDDDIQLNSLTLDDKHCWVKKVEDGTCTLVGGVGTDVFHNGKKINNGEESVLNVNDRVIIANEMFMFADKNKEAPEEDAMSAEDAKDEYRKALRAAQGVGGGGGDADMQEKMRQFEEEKAAWEKRKAEGGGGGGGGGGQSEAAQFTMEQAYAAMDKTLLDMAPKVRTCQFHCDMLNRDIIRLELTLQRNPNASADSAVASVPDVMVKVHNKESGEQMLMNSTEFESAAGILADEHRKMQIAFKNSKAYALPEAHDPVTLLFDNSAILGTATHFLMDLSCMLETDDEEVHNDIRNAVSPYNAVGKLKVKWVPLAGEDAEEDAETPDWEGEEMIGKPWTYKIKIEGAAGLPLMTDECYCEYTFWGETYVTETVEQNTRNPVWNYEHVHHIHEVTEEFLEYLQSGTMNLNVYVNPFVDPPSTKCDNENPKIKANYAAGKPVMAVGSTVNKLLMAKASSSVWAKISTAMADGGTTVELVWAEEGIEDQGVQDALSHDIRLRLQATVEAVDGKATITWTNDA